MKYCIKGCGKGTKDESIFIKDNTEKLNAGVFFDITFGKRRITLPISEIINAEEIGEQLICDELEKQAD